MNIRFVKRNTDAIPDRLAEEIAKELGIHPKAAELLVCRGICSSEDAKHFLDPGAELFHDPFLMKGMAQAVLRLNQAIQNRETIVVYGDYDADGICASAILTQYLVGRGVKVFPHIPSRFGEGYGLSINSIEYLIEEIAPDLILTCDCGSSGVKEVAHCLDLGVDIIVTDHHEISGEIPECVVVNPKQPGCGYPASTLCGAGVALKLVEALGGREASRQYLDLAAVATVADLVPLLNENRLIVQLGLSEDNLRNRGLAALCRAQELSGPVTAGDIAFKIAPRINAAGRMGDADRAFELLTTDNTERAAAIIAELEEDNQKRKTLSDEMYREAAEDIRFEDLVASKAIVLSHPSWEKGITGILAARIAGSYRRPAFIVVNAGENYKGTCRSIGCINIYELLVACSDLLIEFGGHSQAAGFSIEKKNIEPFKIRINELLKDIPSEVFLPTCEYDLDLTEKDIDLDLVKDLERFEPFGNSNPRPIFRILAEKLSISPCKNNYRHTNLITENGFGILAFNHYHQNQFLVGDGQKELAVELSLSSFGNKESVKAVLRAVAPEKLYIDDEIARANFLKSVMIKKTSDAAFKTYSEFELDGFADGNIYGTLFVAGCKDTYEKFLRRFGQLRLQHEFLFFTTPGNLTRIIVSPSFDADFELNNYAKIIFLDSPVGEGLISFLNKKTDAAIFVPQMNNEINFTAAVDCSRTSFLKYYDIIRRNEGLTANNVFEYYQCLKSRADEPITASGYIAALAVFRELGLITVGGLGFSLTVNQGVKADLSASAVYRYLCEKSEAVK